MRVATEVLPGHIAIGEALDRVRSSALRAWPVADRRGVIGAVSLASLERACAKGAAGKLLCDFVDARTFPHVHADQPLDLALERMGAAGLEVLPVVSRADMNKLEGVIMLGDLLASFGIDLADESRTLVTRLRAENGVPFGVSTRSGGSETDRAE